VIEVTDKTVEFTVCDYCDDAPATHCIGITEDANTCAYCLDKMSKCAEQGHDFHYFRVLYCRLQAFHWFRCSSCRYDDLEPMYNVPAPRTFYRYTRFVIDGKNYLPPTPLEFFDDDAQALP
jgi:hypothetical protein